MRAAAHKRASVTLSAKSKKSWAERRSVLMWKRASRLSAYSQTSLCTRASAHNPIKATKIPLKHSNRATALSTCRWRRWYGSGLGAGWGMNAGGDSRAEYHGHQRWDIQWFPVRLEILAISSWRLVLGLAIAPRRSPGDDLTSVTGVEPRRV